MVLDGSHDITKDEGETEGSERSKERTGSDCILLYSPPSLPLRLFV